MARHTIELTGIKKIYQVGGQEVAALAGIDLIIDKGEFAALMGPSGSGKSTLMNILGCLDRPTSGSYKLDGDEVATLSDDALALTRNQRIGFVFQNFNLLSRITAAENVALPLVYAGVGRRALVNDPHIIMADEPTGNLDTKSTGEIMEIFEGLHEAGRTIILVTHEPEIAACASRQLLVRDGLITRDAGKGEKMDIV